MISVMRCNAIAIVIFCFLIAPGCTSLPIPLDKPQQDFCAEIPEHQVSNLSHYLQPLTDNMNTKTGVYVLEQGTEAMLTRAWLTEQAEHTIDVQYFIFSVDNVGLIATDYLVKAAERGVKVRVLVDDIMLQAKDMSCRSWLLIKIFPSKFTIQWHELESIGDKPCLI